MATVLTKPASHPPKMKRPPPPLGQPGINGVRPPHQSPPSSSPSSASKRLPGSSQPGGANAANTPMANGINGASHLNNPIKGQLNRSKKDVQKPVEPTTRLQKSISRNASIDNGRRVGKMRPEPYVKTTPYILKKYAKHPPSLIVHLHPTHFRFEQQDGSFPYNSEMKVIIEHIRAGTVPHDVIEELLRANVRFYEGCLIVRVVDHKSATAQARKTRASKSNDNNTPFSIHNYNEHITPSAFVPYPKNNQLAAEQAVKETKTDDAQPQGKEAAKDDSPSKGAPLKPRVFTTVLHPTARSLQAELTLLATTPDPRAANQQAAHASSPTVGSNNQGDRGHVAKRQKMLVEPQDLQECESKLIEALAPPLFLDPVDGPEAAQALLKFLESPLHRDPPPSPRRRKRTVAELAADEALAAEEERFMLIMDERLEPTASNGAGATKSTVDEASGGAPFEPRFSRFKTLENIRMQHEEKAKREHETKLKQEMVKRQQQEVERERRRALEQRQADEQARDEARRQQLAAHQAQLAAQQQQSRHAMAHANNISQGPQSSPVVRNQTPLNASSPMPGHNMVTQAGVPMSITSSAQGGAGSPPRPPSALQHPNVIGHPMMASRSQQGGPSRHGTPQVTHGTPAMSHATPIMRNVTPSQRMSQGSPHQSNMSQTPVMNQNMMATPQIGGSGMGLTPQQQQMLMHQRQQQLLAQQGHLGHGGLTPQHFTQLQANVHAQQNIQQQQLMQQHAHQQQQQQRSQQAYQAQLVRAQYAQMQMTQQQQQNQQTQNPQGQVQQNQNHQGNPQMTPQQQQQQQLLMAAAQANGGQLPQNVQMTQRYTHLYQQQIVRLRQEMAAKLMPQYGPPSQYPAGLAQQYSAGTERHARATVQALIRREREASQQRAAAFQMQQQQQQQQNMMHNAMGK